MNRTEHITNAANPTADPRDLVTELPSGPNAGSEPEWIAAGPGGDLSFTDAHGVIGQIRSGATPALDAPAPAYIPTADDVGHRLACRLTATYPLPFSATATFNSAAITIQPAPPPPPTPALSALSISSQRFTLRGAGSGAAASCRLARTGATAPAPGLVRNDPPFPRRNQSCTDSAKTPPHLALAPTVTTN